MCLNFDTQVCHKRHICLRFHRILKVIIEMAFSAYCTQIWKFNEISMTIISKVTLAFDATAGSSDAWRCPTEGENCAVLCKSVVKVASHVDMFSLCILWLMVTCNGGGDGDDDGGGQRFSLHLSHLRNCSRIHLTQPTMRDVMDKQDS